MLTKCGILLPIFCLRKKNDTAFIITWGHNTRHSTLKLLHFFAPVGQSYSFFTNGGGMETILFYGPWVRIVGVDASLGLPPLDPASRILRDCILSMMISQSSKLLLATGCIYRNRTMSMVIKGDFALAHRPCNWLQRQKMIFCPVWALPPGLSQFSFHLSPSSRDDISWGHGAQTQNHPKRHVRHRRNP